MNGNGRNGRLRNGGSRKRRAAPQDIYPMCKISNTCPPDILNKYENNTLADRILKWISPFLYFGGQGISTGRGTGAGSGYIPLDPGAVDVFEPGETIIPGAGAGGASAAESGVTVGIPPVPVRPIDPEILAGARDFYSNDPYLHYPVRPGPDVPPIDTAVDGTSLVPVVPDVLEPIPPDLPPIEPPVIVSRSNFDNPTFEVSITASTTGGESSAVDHIFVGERTGGVNVGGGEEIPLHTFSSSGLDPAEFDVEDTEFMTSTPEGRPPPARRGYLYNRRLVQQVEVTEPAFLEQPRDLIVFENPVYNEQDLTMIFENEVNELLPSPPRAAPHRDFTDLKYLGRRLFSRAPSGRVRVSRLGKKGTLTTRSGVQVGTHVHYYQDLSSIHPLEEIELAPLGEVSGIEETAAEGETPFYEIDLNDAAEGVAAEGDSEQPLLIEQEDEDIAVPVPEVTFRNFFPEDVIGIGDLGIIVDYPKVSGDEVRPPKIIPEDIPWTPFYFGRIDVSTEFFYEPSLFKRRRKRVFSY
ncbi:L2 protein [Eumops bonariensis papillomavirus type 2]|nr:L2 protein [Eumops bonariensis papillomavirus type 2]